jgi:primosomal replication protein N
MRCIVTILRFVHSMLSMIYKCSFAIGHNSWSNESLLNSRPWLMMKVLLVLQVYSCQKQEKQQRKF